MNNPEIEPMNVSDLTFDTRNPRLSEFELSDKSEETDLIRILWESMDVRELVMSIAASGFFPHEPVIVAREDDKNIVIEGNRRLAAVKILLKPDLAADLKADVSITEHAKKALTKIPTISGTRRGAWRYLGFKHVNGPAKWSSYAKSKYIASVHMDYRIPLEDIARQIGDTHRTVQRLFRGFMVIKQAERLKVFDRHDRWRKHFAFSHLYTGIHYPGIGSFLGLHPEDEENPEPVPSAKTDELREIFLWMYGSKRENTPPVVVTQNPHLRRLAAVVDNRQALSALRDGIDLAEAWELSRPSSSVFEDHLHAAKRSLQKAHGMIAAGYDGSEELLRVAGTVANIADSLYEEMDRKRNPRRKKRIAEFI